ncbi:MFS transporter (Seo1) [Kalmusia sp. IMI 367209]|nr:MFS transporter (Seo1) [Kalmusia sp. IMI 367209]
MASHSGVPREKWWKIQWFSTDDTPEEKKFITKLDLILIPYLFVTYWVKNLDQNNLNIFADKDSELTYGIDNAYVGGMKEELGFYGNELIRLQTMYIVGAVLGQIPFLFLFTYWPMYWVIPGMDVMWMYIICAIITIPVGLVGCFIIPGTLDKPNKFVLNDNDRLIARQRLGRNGHKMQGKLKSRHIKQIMSSKHFWIVVFVDVLFWNAGINSGAFLLWLKSLKKYDSATVNEYGTIPPAMGIFFTLFANFSSDLLWGPVWAITFASGMNTLTNLILLIWNVPDPAKWFAYCNYGWSYALSSVLHGWVNNILRDSPEMRSFTLVFINIIAQSSTAWTGLLAYPTVEAPRFLKGYSFSFSMSTSLIVGAHLLNLYLKRRKDPKTNESSSTPDIEDTDDGSLQGQPGDANRTKSLHSTHVTAVS